MQILVKSLPRRRRLDCPRALAALEEQDGVTPNFFL
jgi:hypothetical protein